MMLDTCLIMMLMINSMFFSDFLRISADFKYQRNIFLGDGLSAKNTFPWHAYASESLDLELFIDNDELMHYFEAFAIHSTAELPMVLLPEDIFEFADKRKLEVVITPSVIRSDESLKALQAFDRKCYFEGERKLRFFKIYTKRNCEIECFSNFSLEECKCVSFDIVRDSDTRVCDTDQKEQYCIFFTKEKFRDD